MLSCMPICKSSLKDRTFLLQVTLYYRKTQNHINTLGKGSIKLPLTFWDNYYHLKVLQDQLKTVQPVNQLRTISNL
jgi:hypothetical protein